MDDILWLTMRRMRGPLILMILVFALSIFGMVQIPGRDEMGNPIAVGYLDAAYFVAITATTIGFGEYPTAFTGAQRLYAFLILFPNVIVWLNAIGTILGLFLDPQFRHVLRGSRFRRQVRRVAANGFFIVCGFGNTGNMIVRALLYRGYQAVVLERDPQLVHNLALDDAIAHVPAMEGDVTDRRLLEQAGLAEPNCRGIIAITNEDHANLTIAITAKLLRPDLLVLARSETERVAANLASFGTDYVVDPYVIFAERLHLAISSPAKYLLQDWLISVPGSHLREAISPPVGRWIICGAGRFGSRIARCLEESSLPYTLIDIHPERVKRPGDVLGRGTEADTLVEAGIHDAVGIVAGTGDDVDNLSIILTARQLNPHLFTVARQERQQNDKLFDRLEADLVARRSMIVARRILYIVTTPLLPIFLQHMINQNDAFAQRVTARLKSTLAGKSPAIWMTVLTGEMGAGLREAERAGVRIRLEHLTRSSRAAEATSLDCVCLLLERGAGRTFLPDAAQELHVGDRLLMAGRDYAQLEMAWTLTEPLALLANATGADIPRSAVWRYLSRRQIGGKRGNYKPTSGQ